MKRLVCCTRTFPKRGRAPLAANGAVARSFVWRIMGCCVCSQVAQNDSLPLRKVETLVHTAAEADNMESAFHCGL